MQERNILIVDKNDIIIDTAYKLLTHQKGILHRAFSVLIFNNRDQLLIQRRAPSKYHSASLWANTCCGHPFNEKPIIEYAQQRLMEEMGMSCDLEFIFKFTYCTTLEDGIIENEIDHVFIGISEQQPTLNPHEADLFMWIDEENLRKDMQKHPSKYAIWFQLILKHLEQNSLTFKKIVETYGI